MSCREFLFMYNSAKVYYKSVYSYSPYILRKLTVIIIFKKGQKKRH